MNRGRRREDIFLSKGDYNTFITVLQETAEMWNLKVSAYCLMSNHYHLLVHTPEGNLSRCMRNINGVYTQRFNRLHKLDGQLFRGRYKAVLVEADIHLLEVLRYIHRNPIQAGLVTKLDNYPWSSHHGFISRAKKWEWLQKDFLLSMLSEKKTNYRSAYLDFVSQGAPESIERFYSLKNLPSLLGSDKFKEWVKDKFNHLRFAKEIPDSRELAVSADNIILHVSDYFKVAKEQVADSKRGTENLPRDIAMYLIRHHTGETLAKVGRHFGVDNYSTVSSAVQRIKARKRKDRKVQNYLVEIERRLRKGQRQT